MVFDAYDSFVIHISNTCSSCFSHIRDLRRVRRFLSHDDAAVSLANVLASRRREYCDTLLGFYGVPTKYIDRLQNVPTK